MTAHEIRESIILENEGMKLFGILHIPRHVNNPPCVFFCHGLAGNKIGKDRLYVEIAGKLAQEGIASFRMDCRGAGDSEGLFIDVLPEHYVEDTVKALEFLEERDDIDKTRIGIMARSFGGPVAIESASKWGKIKSLALWCPMFSGDQWKDQWQLLLSNSLDEEQAKEMMRINGQQGSATFFERFMQINVGQALTHVSSVPMLHIHGEEDTQVTLDHAHQYELIRQTASGLTQFVRLPKTDHDFSNFDEKQKSISETVNWFKRTL